LCIALLIVPPLPVYASEICDPPNVIPKSVCDFDTFRGSPPRQLPNGWTEFILEGNPSFSPSDDTYWGAPSLMVRSDGDTFHIGIYTQASVEQGKGYRASIAWGAPNAPSTFGRQLGIDPYGGTDPTSSNVIWGPEHYGDGRILNYPPPDVNIDVRARAAGGTMTVFFKVNHPRSTGDNLIFIDAIALYPDESAPLIEPPTPAATPTFTPPPYVPPPTFTYAPPTFTYAPPPTAIPATVPVFPTNTPRPLATATKKPTSTATPPPTSTSTSTSTPTVTPSATPSPTPSWTPWPTVPPVDEGGSGLQAAQLQLARSLRRSTEPQQLAAVSTLGFGGAGLSAILLWAVRRRRRTEDERNSKEGIQ